MALVAGGNGDAGDLLGGRSLGEWHKLKSGAKEINP